MDKVTINGKNYLFKYSNYALGQSLKRLGIKLGDMNDALTDLTFVYELIYQIIRFQSSVTKTSFAFSDNKEAFFAEIDDDAEAINKCMEIISKAFDTNEEESEKTPKKKAIKA